MDDGEVTGMAEAGDGGHARSAADPLGPLSAWVGSFRGEGHGDFPTIDGFDYLEEVVFTATSRPVLAYGQRTRGRDQRPLHAESGFLRRVATPDEHGSVDVEWVIAHPTGLAEISVGTVRAGVVDTTCRPHRTPTAVVVTEVRRRYVLDGDRLDYDLWMATVDVPDTTHHLRATLHRVHPDDGPGTPTSGR